MSSQYSLRVLEIGSDLCPEISKLYSVSNEFPFELQVENGFSPCLYFSARVFPSRIKAEEARLEAFINYYETELKKIQRVDNTFSRKKKKMFFPQNNKFIIQKHIETYKTKLKTLEEDHPEWMI